MEKEEGYGEFEAIIHRPNTEYVAVIRSPKYTSFILGPLLGL